MNGMRNIVFDPKAFKQFNDEHRLVYKVTETEIIIINCKFHY
ncbi:type II toxin-antitoxin system YoeB family toxin [Geminocystis sp. CENA526]